MVERTPDKRTPERRARQLERVAIYGQMQMLERIQEKSSGRLIGKLIDLDQSAETFINTFINGDIWPWLSVRTINVLKDTVKKNKLSTLRQILCLGRELIQEHSAYGLSVLQELKTMFSDFGLSFESLDHAAVFKRMMTEHEIMRQRLLELNNLIDDGEGCPLRWGYDTDFPEKEIVKFPKAEADEEVDAHG